MAEWIKGTIIENIHWTEALFSLKIDADAATFTAGQFASLALDIDGQRVARPYSYLSSPGQRPLEFFFYTAVDGVLSNALFKLEPGDSVWVKRPANGFFVLREIPEAEDLWMMGTGTGIAPFLSILNTDEPWQRFKRIALIYAVRHQADMRYLEVIDTFKERHGGRFAFQPFISREVIPGALPGRIPAAIENSSLQRAIGWEFNPDHSHFMLCGNPDMVKDVTELLKSRSFQKNRRRTPGHITTENYW